MCAIRVIVAIHIDDCNRKWFSIDWKHFLFDKCTIIRVKMNTNFHEKTVYSNNIEFIIAIDMAIVTEIGENISE